MPIDRLDSHDMFFATKEFHDWFDKDLCIYHCTFNKDSFSNRLFEQHNVVMPDRLQKSVLKRRSEYFAGRYCAINSLRRFSVETSFIDTGINREPLWPEGLIGSISHCSNRAVAVVERASRFLGIGIDIEDKVNNKTMNNIQGQILNADEAEIISYNAEQKAILFTMAFSLKEAFFKAAYSTVGRYFGFDAVSIVNIDYLKKNVLFELNETLDELLPKGMVVEGSYRILSDEQVVTCVTLDHSHCRS